MPLPSEATLIIIKPLPPEATFHYLKKDAKYHEKIIF
jgi:hypothetical protein